MSGVDGEKPFSVDGEDALVFRSTGIGYDVQQQELALAEEAMRASLPPAERLRLARQAVGECFAPRDPKAKPDVLPRTQIGERRGMIH